MKFTLILLFSIIISFQFIFSQSPNFQGDWLGKLRVSGIELRLVFHINKEDSVLSTKLDSPDQNALGILANKTEVIDDSIYIELFLMGATYAGKLKDSVIQGTFKQAGQSFELDLKKTQQIIHASKRPQTPKPPFNYNTKEVTIKTTYGIELAGTITQPKGKGPFPGVVLISGSGPQDRNEEILRHKPFWVIADYLAKKGFTVLRYDDRGIGKSTGIFEGATTFDFAKDAQTAYEFLNNYRKIDTSRIGLIGHSEGGLIAPIIAAENKHVDFIVLLAGPSVQGSKIIVDQQELIALAAGTDSSKVKKDVVLFQNMMDFILKNQLSEQLNTELQEQIRYWISEIKIEVPQQFSPGQYAQYLSNAFTNNWMKSFIAIDPADFLKQVDCPILALFGEKDLQVSVRANLEQMKKFIKPNNGSQLTVFENLNHLFQTANSGSPVEYQLIEETISPLVLEYVFEWMTKK